MRANRLTCASDARWQSSPPCSQGCCAHNLQALTIAGNQHPDMEALGDGVVNVLLSPCQQDAIQNLQIIIGMFQTQPQYNPCALSAMYHTLQVILCHSVACNICMYMFNHVTLCWYDCCTETAGHHAEHTTGLFRLVDMYALHCLSM